MVPFIHKSKQIVSLDIVMWLLAFYTQVKIFIPLCDVKSIPIKFMGVMYHIRLSDILHNK